MLKDIDVSKLDWSQLNVDASTLGDGPAAKLRASQASDGAGMSWSNRNGTNGSSAVSVKQSVTPYWDARIGADMTVTREPTTMSELLAERTANGGNLPQSGGSAWAAITAPGAGSVWDKTAVEARVDPNQDQGRFGTSISKQVPLGEQYSLTFSNGANLIQQGVVPGLGATPRTERTYQTEQSAKLEVTETGTSVSAGPDAVDLRRQMAAQARRRAEAVRRRLDLRLGRRDCPGHHQQEHHAPASKRAGKSRFFACLKRPPASPGKCSTIAATWPRCGQIRPPR